MAEHSVLATLTRPLRAQVVAVGPGARTRDGEVVPMSVAEGDKVLLPEYGGHSIKLDDNEFHLFRNDDILGVLKE